MQIQTEIFLGKAQHYNLEKGCKVLGSISYCTYYQSAITEIGYYAEFDNIDALARRLVGAKVRYSFPQRTQDAASKIRPEEHRQYFKVTPLEKKTIKKNIGKLKRNIGKVVSS